jgi:UDP-N-acetylmuramyl pentapeptide phosphotransferase/UDP-N-acetylglucosamine-1-phosphate transferase
MSNAQIALILGAIVAPVSAFLVWRVIPIGRQLAIVNRSGVPTPRIGGIPVAIAFWLGIALSFALPVARFPVEVERISLICIAGAIIVLFMLVDDALGLAPRTKLAIQIAVASVMVLPRLRNPYHGIAIEQFNAPGLGQVEIGLPFALAATVIWFVAMMNAINWIDGIDGLAPTVTLVASIILFLHTYFWPRNDPQFTISILPLVLGAALLGFLPFNWFPARITLGDAGSNFIGLTIAAISIVGGAKLATALLVLGLPLLDLVWVTVSRGIRGQPIATGDKSHLHHRLLARGWGVGRIVAFVGSVSLFFGVLSLVLPTKEAKLGAMLALAAVLLFTVGRPGLRGTPSSFDR